MGCGAGHGVGRNRLRPPRSVVGKKAAVNFRARRSDLLPFIWLILRQMLFHKSNARMLAYFLFVNQAIWATRP